MTDADEPRWRRKGRDERRTDILVVAIRAFGEQPYSAVQMTDIARNAGVTRGLLNHYFGTKRDLYLEVVRSMMFVPVLNELHLPEGNRRERIEAWVDWFLAVQTTHGATWVAVGADGLGGDPEIRQILEDADDQAAQSVLDAVGFTGTGDEHRRALAAIRAYGGLVKAAVREWVGRESLDYEDVRDILITSLDTVLTIAIGADADAR